jgi:hypothetical protein
MLSVFVLFIIGRLITDVYAIFSSIWAINFHWLDIFITYGKWPKYIFWYLNNVRILCLSCMANKYKTTCKFAGERRSNRFQGSSLCCHLFLNDRSTWIRYQKIYFGHLPYVHQRLTFLPVSKTHAIQLYIFRLWTYIVYLCKCEMYVCEHNWKRG